MSNIRRIWARQTGRVWYILNGWRAGQNGTALSLAAIVLAVVIGAADLLTGPEISFSLFYFPALGLAAWYGTPTAATVMPVICAGAWLGADLLASAWSGHPASSAWIPPWNALVRYGIFLVFVKLVRKVRNLQFNLETEVAAKTAELSQEVLRRTAAEHEATEASERERQRVATELHDQLGALLAGIGFKARFLADELQDQPSKWNRADELVDLLRRATVQTRALSSELVGGSGESRLCPALEKLARNMEELFEISCTFLPPGSCPCPMPCSREKDGNGERLWDCHLHCFHLLRLTQEAVRNAVEHGLATHVAIEMQRTAECATLEIRDNGRGFIEADPLPMSLGLTVMKDRARALGGSMQVLTAPGRGCTIRCHIPFQPSAEPQPQPVPSLVASS